LKELEERRSYMRSLDDLQDQVKTYFDRFDGVTEAPSGAQFALSMVSIQLTRIQFAESANPELDRKLSDLVSVLKPVLEANQKLLEKMGKTGGRVSEPEWAKYIRSYPAREVSRLLEALSDPIKSEKAKLQPLLAELAEYERAHR
jgi:hypothetical protein